MKLSTNFVARQQAEASRPEMDIDVDLITLLIQLSILSPIFFKGARAQFVVGAGEKIGSSPAWTAPGNRLSEFFRKSPRGLQQGSRSNEIRVEDGNGAALVEYLRGKLQGIGDLGRYTLGDLKNVFQKCFDDGISKLDRKEQFVDVLTGLHAFWISYGNPQGGSCSKLFLGKGSYKSAGVMGYAPSGVMVMHKVPPDLVVYDTPCQLW